MQDHSYFYIVSQYVAIFVMEFSEATMDAIPEKLKEGLTFYNSDGLLEDPSKKGPGNPGNNKHNRIFNWLLANSTSTPTPGSDLEYEPVHNRLPNEGPTQYARTLYASVYGRDGADKVLDSKLFRPKSGTEGASWTQLWAKSEDQNPVSAPLGRCRKGCDFDFFWEGECKGRKNCRPCDADVEGNPYCKWNGGIKQCCGKIGYTKNPAWIDPNPPSESDIANLDVHQIMHDTDQRGVRTYSQNEYAVAGIDLCLAIEETVTHTQSAGNGGEKWCAGQVECCFDLWPGGSDNDCCPEETWQETRRSCACINIGGGLLSELLNLLPWLKKGSTASIADTILGFLQGRGLGGSKEFRRIKKGGLDQLKGWIARLLDAIGNGLWGATFIGLNPFDVKSIKVGCDKGCPWTLAGFLFGIGNCDTPGRWIETGNRTQSCVCCDSRFFVADNVWPDGSVLDKEDPQEGRSKDTTFQTKG